MPWIFAAILADVGIKSVTKYRKSNRGHVDSQLMFFPRLRSQPKQSETIAVLEQIDKSHCVDRAINNSLAKPRFPAFKSVFDAPMCGTRKLADDGHRQILPLD